MMNRDLGSQLLAAEQLLQQIKDSIQRGNQHNQPEEPNTEPGESATVPEQEARQDEDVAALQTPLYSDRKVPLTLLEAFNCFSQTDKAIFELPYKPESGLVFLFKAENEQKKEDWRSNGHRWYQLNGGRWAFQNLLKRRQSNCVTPSSGPNGTNSFQMYSWIHRELSNDRELCPHQQPVRAYQQSQC